MKELLDKLKKEAEGFMNNGYLLIDREFGRGMMKVIDALNCYDEKAHTKMQNAIINAENFLCDSDITIAEQVDAIKNYPNKNILIDYIDGIEVWEKLQFKLTCKEFLSAIGYE